LSKVICCGQSATLEKMSTGLFNDVTVIHQKGKSANPIATASVK
jgi:hypothetical protein